MLITDFARAQADKLHAMTGGKRLYPVNLKPAVKCLGAELWEREGLGSGLVGALVDKRLGDAPVIFMNTSETVFWQRFNVACMLGHIMEREHRGMGDRYSYLCMTHSPAPTELYSHYVERFTLEFLAPPSKVRELLGEGRTIPYMVGVFGVPLPKLLWWVEECQMRT